MSSEPYIGAIKIFGFGFPPRGYALCNGALLSINQNTALFSLLGTTYGGNGVQTFGLPDLRGRVANGQGQGPGLQSYVMGQVAGAESITLTQQQMPQHTHMFVNTSTLNAVQAKATDQIPAAGSQLARPSLENGTDTPRIYVPAGAAGDSVPLGGVNVAGTNSVVGGSQPFSNLQPYLTLNFSIALQGIFPSRN